MTVEEAIQKAGEDPERGYRECVYRILEEHPELYDEDDGDLLLDAADEMFEHRLTSHEALEKCRAREFPPVRVYGPDPFTPEELYESIFELADDAVPKPVIKDTPHVSTGRAILTRQAASLRSESCFLDIKTVENSRYSWRITVVFSDGVLSPQGQSTLRKMQFNADRSSFSRIGDQNAVVFIVDRK